MTVNAKPSPQRRAAAPRSGARFALVLSFLSLAGCYRVAEVPPSQVPLLTGHGPGSPPVAVRTIDGDVAVIHGEFKEVRIFVSDEGAEREIALRPPFRATGDGAWLGYETPRLSPRSIDLQTVRKVHVVQRDGGRTSTILLVAGGTFVAGFVATALLQAQSEEQGGYLNCSVCGPMIFGMLASGISFLFVVPLTKYY